MTVASVAALCLAVLLAICLGPRANAADADLARVKANLIEYWTGAGADPGDPLVAGSLRGVEREARSALTAMRPDGSWGEINYGEGPDQEARLSRHLGRIGGMALGFRTPGQPLAGNAELVHAVEQSLSFIHGFVREDCPMPGNWWYWQIQMPRTLGEILLLMEGRLRPETAAEVAKAMRYLLMEEAFDGLRPSQAGRWHRTLLPVTGPTAEHAALHAGQNRIWVALNHFYLAMATDDLKRAAIVQAAFADECRVQTGEGIKEDSSFHQHGPLLYTGGYGRGFTEDVAAYVWITRDTRYQLPGAGLTAFAGYVLDGAVWSIYRNYYDPSVCGREITRGNRRQMGVPFSLLVLANVPGPRQAEAARAAKSFYQVRPSYSARAASLWSAVKDSPVEAAMPLGHRHYWESDYTIHRRPGFFASLRMWSERTKPAELINGEGLTSWHQSDGMLWTFLTGSEYVTHDVMATLDWLRLPGTTVEHKALKPAEGYDSRPAPGNRAFVGGAFTNDGGVSAMELAAAVPPLTAKKSWVFFGDEIVCLGSDINCPSENPAETIVNQWPLSDPAAPLTVDGKVVSALPWAQEMPGPKWAHCDGIGYVFPEPHSVKLQRVMQTGSWRALSESGDDTPHTNPFLTLWFDHGPRARDATYAYVLLPAKTAAETQAYAEASPITILRHDNDVHAVRKRDSSAVGIVFWKPAALGKVAVDRACLVYYEDTAEGLTLAVSDPTHQASTIRVTIDESLTPTDLPAGVTSATGGGKTVVSVQAENGRNYMARFRR